MDLTSDGEEASGGSVTNTIDVYLDGKFAETVLAVTAPLDSKVVIPKLSAIVGFLGQRRFYLLSLQIQPGGFGALALDYEDKTFAFTGLTPKQIKARVPSMWTLWSRTGCKWVKFNASPQSAAHVCAFHEFFVYYCRDGSKFRHADFDESVLDIDACFRTQPQRPDPPFPCHCMWEGAIEPQDNRTLLALFRRHERDFSLSGTENDHSFMQSTWEPVHDTVKAMAREYYSKFRQHVGPVVWDEYLPADPTFIRVFTWRLGGGPGEQQDFEWHKDGADDEVPDRCLFAFVLCVFVDAQGTMQVRLSARPPSEELDIGEADPEEYIKVQTMNNDMYILAGSQILHAVGAPPEDTVCYRTVAFFYSHVSKQQIEADWEEWLTTNYHSSS